MRMRSFLEVLEVEKRQNMPPRMGLVRQLWSISIHMRAHGAGQGEHRCCSQLDIA